MWRNRQTGGEFILHTDIRYELWKQGIQAPGVLTDEYLTSVGYDTVTRVNPPYDSITQGVRLLPAVNVNGEWVQQYELYDLDPITVANNRNIEEVVRVNRVKTQLAELDLKQIRSLKEIMQGNGAVPDATGKTPQQYFDERETEIATLRATL